MSHPCEVKERPWQSDKAAPRDESFSSFGPPPSAPPTNTVSEQLLSMGDRDQHRSDAPMRTSP